MEYKTPGTLLSVGQRIMLERFSRLPGCVAVVVWAHVEDMAPLGMMVARGGKWSDFGPMTLVQHRAIVAEWWSHGEMHAPVMDAPAQMDLALV